MAALGEVMSDRQRPDKAAKWFERALILRPDWVEVRRRLAELLVEQDNPRAAIPHLKKLLETKAYADNAETHGVLGLAFARNRNAKAAAMHYREALALRPEFASVHANLGMLLSEQGSADRALFHLSEAIRLGSNEAEVHFARSNLLLARGSEREGLAALRRAVGARPNWLAPVNNLAWHLVSVSDEALRDPSEALGYARLAARLSSRANPSVLETLAAVLESDGRIEEAIAVLHEAIALARGGRDLVLAKRLTAHQNRLRSSPPLLHRND
jgi:tetratricopeptide (TPR) repeat protein